MSTEKEFWCFLGIEQSNLRVVFNGFFQCQDATAYFLHPAPGKNKAAVIDELTWEVEQKLPMCKLYFILYARVYELYGDPLIEAIRAKRPDSQWICYYGDLVEKHAFTIEKAASVFDYLFTFDQKQAKKYHLKFLQAPMGDIDTTPREILYDVIFVGEAKDRLGAIMAVYQQLKSRGFRCKFYIRGVREQDREDVDDIVYRGMPYEELIELDKQSHCILEIMQHQGAYSPTLRRTEALLLNKKLLTNCPALSNSEDPHILYFKDVRDIKFDRIKEPVQKGDINWKEEFSAQKMILSIKTSIV